MFSYFKRNIDCNYLKRQEGDIMFKILAAAAIIMLTTCYPIHALISTENKAVRELLF